MIHRYFPKLLFRRFSSRTSVINSLKYKFQGKVTMTDVPGMICVLYQYLILIFIAIKIIVESSSFNLLPKMDQHKAVLDSLPDEWKSKVVIETNALGGEIDREVFLNLFFIVMFNLNKINEFYLYTLFR